MHFKSLIHCIENFFTVQDFWATCACPEKQSLPWKFSLYWIYFLSFRIFEQLAFSLKNRVALKFLTVLNHFYDSGFWATCACPENRVCPEFTVLNIYLLSLRCFEQLALALKNTSCPEMFLCIEIFLSFRIFEQLAFALKTEFVLKVLKPGGMFPPASYAYESNTNNWFLIQLVQLWFSCGRCTGY